MSDRRAFTLTELLFTVSVVAIVTSVALPNYFKSVEQGRRTEANYILHLIRASELRYEAEHKTFTTSWTDLDIDDPSPQSHTFAYTISGADANNFLAVATRTGVAVTYLLQIDRSGTITEVVVAVEEFDIK